MEQDGRVGLLEEEEPRDLDHGIGYSSSPEDPAPSRLFGYETTGYGADGWAEEGSETVDADGKTTLFGSEEI